MTDSNPGNLVLKSMYLTIMIHLAWTDIGNRQSKEESYTCACNISSFLLGKKYKNTKIFFSHHIKL